MANMKATSSIAIFLSLNLVFFTLSSACGNCPTPVKSSPPPPKPKSTPNCPPPPTPSNGRGKCPIDTLKLGVCANVLGGLIGVSIGTPPKTPCCSLIDGLVDLEAAICLCTALRASVLGINLNVPVSLSLLLNVCSKKVPSGFVCA